MYLKFFILTVHREGEGRRIQTGVGTAVARFAARSSSARLLSSSSTFQLSTARATSGRRLKTAMALRSLLGAAVLGAAVLGAGAVPSASRRALQQSNGPGIGATAVVVDQMAASRPGYSTYQVAIRFDAAHVLDVYGARRTSILDAPSTRARRMARLTLPRVRRSPVR